MKIIIYITQILVILFFQSVSAKKPGKKKTPTVTPWEIGVSSGVSLFVTSVNPEKNAVNKQTNYWRNEINAANGLFVVRNISPSIGVEVNWLNTRLTGKWNNKWPTIPISAGRTSPLRYNTQINQFDLMMVFNLDQMLLPGDPEDQGHFFIKAGVGLAQIKDLKKFYSADTYTRFSYGLGAGYSVSLTKEIKLQIGNTLRSVNTDNLDGVHVVENGNNGQMVYFMHVFEIYNYTYLTVSYNMGNFGSGKYKRR